MNETTTIQKEYAGFLRRAAAFLIDFFIGVTIFILPLFIISTLPFTDVTELIVPFLWTVLISITLFWIVIFILYPYLMSKYGGTPGKIIAGIRIENLDGSNLTFRRAFFREQIAKFPTITSFGLGYYTIFRNEKKQAWHDMLSDTVVVKKHSAILGLITLVILAGASTGLFTATLLNISNNPTVIQTIEKITKELESETQQTSESTESVFTPQPINPIAR